MTTAQINARQTLKKHRHLLSKQQTKTLDGLIKAGDVVGAMNGLNTIVARGKVYGKHKQGRAAESRNRPKAV